MSSSYTALLGLVIDWVEAGNQPTIVQAAETQ